MVGRALEARRGRSTKEKVVVRVDNHLVLEQLDMKNVLVVPE